MHRLLRDERLLNGVGIADRPQAFDRKDRLAVTIAHDRRAVAHRLPIQQNCARAALPDTATEFRSVQLQVVLEVIKNRHVGIVHIRGERVPTDGDLY